MTKFISAVEKNEIKCISKILRVKNGFKNILNWKSLNDCEYVDIKINVLFNNKENTQSQIVEIQFLLDFLVSAKKMGHKFYTIKRKEMEIDSIDHLIYDNSNDYENFKTKMYTLVHDNDLEKLSKQLLFQPNMVLSVIRNNRPLLDAIGSTKQYRMYELFLRCLFHFGEIVLNQSKPDKPCTIYDKDTNTNGKLSDAYATGYDDKDYPPTDNHVKIDENNKLYLQKYLNFSHGGAPIIMSYNFWGLRLSRYDNDQQKALELCEVIMKSNYFNGVTSNSTVYSCIDSKDCQGYMELLLSQLEKNRYGLSLAVNFTYWFHHDKPLRRIFEIKEQHVEWLNIYFDVCDKIKELPDKATFIRVIEKCLRKRDGDSSDDKKENAKREAMLPVLKENFVKFYPDEKMPEISKK